MRVRMPVPSHSELGPESAGRSPSLRGGGASRLSSPPWAGEGEPSALRVRRPATRIAGVISHMATVGILGGGQLACMLALSGAPLGCVSSCSTPSPTPAPASCADGRRRLHRQVRVVRIRVEDRRRHLRFRERAGGKRALARRPRPGVPEARALAVAQDRLAERPLFRELGIPFPVFADIATREALDAAVWRELGLPCILKTRRLGYDGRGQFRIKAHADVDAWNALGAAGRERRPDPRGLCRVPARAQRGRCAAATANSAPGR